MNHTHTLTHTHVLCHSTVLGQKLADPLMTLMTRTLSPRLSYTPIRRFQYEPDASRRKKNKAKLSSSDGNVYLWADKRRKKKKKTHTPCASKALLMCSLCFSRTLMHQRSCGKHRLWDNIRNNACRRFFEAEHQSRSASPPSRGVLLPPLVWIMLVFSGAWGNTKQLCCQQQILKS